jgi:hypothetical protein
MPTRVGLGACGDANSVPTWFVTGLPRPVRSVSKPAVERAQRLYVNRTVFSANLPEEAIGAEAITEIERSYLEAVGKACRLMWRLVWRP